MSTENIYDGKPSIILDHQPFFSIVVACYNSGKTIGNLLESIVNQDMCDDIEVILSDDNSTEDYQDIVNQYRNILSIRQVKTDYNFAPGNTREKGVSVAEGKWLTIADHDDEYIAGSLKEVKNIIESTNEEYYCITDFLEVDPDSKSVIREMKRTMGWNHGKFYNLENLWKKNNIHFKKDLLTHEDICISAQINCAMVANNTTPLFIDIFTYMWNSRPTTVSRVNYKADDGIDHPFLEVFFEDYVNSTAGVYLDKYKEGIIGEEFCIDNVTEVILYGYFYIQSFKFHFGEMYIKKNEDVIKELLIEAKALFGIDNEYIYNLMAQDDAFRFVTIFDSAKIGSGPFIPQETFSQWLDYLHRDIKPRMTMSDAIHK